MSHHSNGILVTDDTLSAQPITHQTTVFPEFTLWQEAAC